jgi:hypothetical protein
MALTALALIMAAYTVRATSMLLKNDLPADHFAGASRWLAANTPEAPSYSKPIGMISPASFSTTPTTFTPLASKCR